MILKNGHIDKFYERPQYFSDIVNSFIRLKQYVDVADSNSIEMRVFKSFIPMSYTSINDYNPNSLEQKGLNEEFIAEFSLPYSTKRILMQVSKNLDKVIFESFTNSIDNLWNVSDDISTIKLNDKIFQNG